MDKNNALFAIFIKKAMLLSLLTFVLSFFIIGENVSAMTDPYAGSRQRVAIYEMTIPEGFEPYRMQDFRGQDYFHITIQVGTSNGEHDYTTRIQQKFIQSVYNRNIFGLLYKVELEPQDWVNRNSWWRSEVRETSKHIVTTTVNMDFSRYTILSWEPRSGARDNYSVKDLTVRALTNTGVSDFGARYIFRSFTQYSRSSSSHLGGVIFEHHAGNSRSCRSFACVEWMNTARVTISHEITYRSRTFGLSRVEASCGNWDLIPWWRHIGRTGLFAESTRVHRSSF